MNVAELTAQAYPDTTERGQQFMTRIIEASPLLRWLNNFGLRATNFQYRPSVGGQTLAARALTASYTPANMAQNALVAAALRIVGFQLDYDESHAVDHELGIGIDIDRWLAQELAERAHDVGEAIEVLLMNGSGSGDTITGLNTIFSGSNLPGLGISGVVNATTMSGVSAVSLDLTTDTNFAKFMEGLEKVRQEMDADGIICNRSMAARLTNFAKASKIYTFAEDAFGRRIDVIDGIPIVRVLDTAITKTEPDDTAETPLTNTTSMYLVQNREGSWTIGSNSGLAFRDIGQLEGKSSRRVGFEFRASHEVRLKRSIRRIRNIKI